MENDACQRWFNYYGRDPFYRLPGKYSIINARSAEFTLPRSDLKRIEPKEWGFPDEVTADEFVHLDEYEPWKILTKKNLAAQEKSKF